MNTVKTVEKATPLRPVDNALAKRRDDPKPTKTD